MKVSIITATFNSQATISRCVESVAMQDALDSIEHIIVDGGSKDNTLGVINRFSHIDTVISEPDDGIYDAFNKGLNAATGDIIYYLNSDDRLFSADVISLVLNAFDMQSIDYLIAPVIMKDPVARTQWLQNPRRIEINGENMNYPSHQGFFINRTLLLSYGGFPRCFSIVADSYVMLKAMKCARGGALNDPVAEFLTSGVSQAAGNTAVVNKELSAIYSLLEINAQIDSAAVAQTNFDYLKTLFIQSLQQSPLNPLLKNQRIGIFGTGVMSVLIAGLLENNNIQIDAFFTTHGAQTPVSGKSVKPAEQVSQIEVLINGIEGKHGPDVEKKCLAYNDQLSIIRWHQLFEHR